MAQPPHPEVIPQWDGFLDDGDEHVKAPGLKDQHVQHVYVVQLVVADVDKRRDGPAQTHQRVRLNGRLEKRCPCEQA